MQKTLNFICAILIVIIGFYLTISLCALFFIFTGQLSVGHELDEGATVPQVFTLLAFQAACVLAMAGLVVIRAKVCKKYDFKYLRPKDT